MTTLKTELASSYRPLINAWLVLVALTIASVILSEQLRGATWLQLLVAGVVWTKGRIIARHFIETHVAHPFIRRVTDSFIAFVPAALVATAFFGKELARLASL